MIRDENGMLTGYVYLNLDGRDPQDYVAEATRLIGQKLNLPGGYALLWSGQYEAFQRINQRLRSVVPLTLALIVILLYWNTRSTAKTALVLLAVPFSAIGAIWSLHLLGYPMSPAVWVGLIALLGVDAETGTFMLLYLDLAYERMLAEGRLRTRADLREAIMTGAVRRARPKFMTVATMFIGLAPIFWSTGAGAEVMKRMAAPMVGGLATSFLMELIVYPMLYEWWTARSVPEACLTTSTLLAERIRPSSKAPTSDSAPARHPARLARPPRAAIHPRAYPCRTSSSAPPWPGLKHARAWRRRSELRRT
jgi:Cu(I)/Ag(I) efflux system membrane protein CusA/SilA